MSYRFGDGFDFTSIFNTVATTAGNVVSAKLNATPTGYPTINPVTGLPYTMASTTSSYSTLLLLGAAGLAAFLIFSRKKGRG